VIVMLKCDVEVVSERDKTKKGEKEIREKEK
jgi:hypothetical protein